MVQKVLLAILMIQMKIFDDTIRPITWKKKNTIKWVYVYDISVDYRAFGTSNIIYIHKYLIKKRDIKYFFCG